MNKIMQERNNLFWEFLSGILLLSVDLYIILHGLRTETPVLNFPLLALLHTLAVLVVLPSVLLGKFPFSRVARRGEMLVIIGGITLIIGFLFVPRSLVIAESGLMLLTGSWVLQRILPEHSCYGSPAPERSLFWGLVLTALTGIFLGLTLARPSIDPIPFRGILLHGFMGIAFTLTSFSVIFSSPEPGIRCSIRRNLTVVFYLLGVACLFTLPLTKNILPWIMASLLFLLGALFLGYRPHRSQSFTGILILTGVIVILSNSGWKVSPGSSMTFFLLAWLYLLAGMSFSSELSGRLLGLTGSLFFLFGVWESQKGYLYTGFLIHFLTVITVVILPVFQRTRQKVGVDL